MSDYSDQNSDGQYERWMDVASVEGDAMTLTLLGVRWVFVRRRCLLVDRIFILKTQHKLNSLIMSALKVHLHQNPRDVQIFFYFSLVSVFEKTRI